MVQKMKNDTTCLEIKMSKRTKKHQKITKRKK